MQKPAESPGKEIGPGQLWVACSPY